MDEKSSLVDSPQVEAVRGTVEYPSIETRSSFHYRVLRRAFDLVVSCSALCIGLPLMAVIALLIKRDGGPVFFRHRRVGRNGNEFTLYKFRTMHADSRQRFPELYSYEYTEEELETLPIKILVGKKFDAERIAGRLANEDGDIDDPRITCVGNWLRKTSLDEFPNFLNVLNGDMHLVGPRPDIEDNVRYYYPEHLRKFDVKPGITGLAQVRGRGELTFHQINEYDVEYVERRSLLLDLKILLATLVICVKREGAY